MAKRLFSYHGIDIPPYIVVRGIQISVVFEFINYDYYLGLRPSGIYNLNIGNSCFTMRFDEDMTLYDIRVYEDYIQVFYGTVSYKGMEVKIPYKVTSKGIKINNKLAS